MKEATRRLDALCRFDMIIGKNHAMQNVFASIKAAAASEASILVQGESGTGKELMACAIHSCSALKKNL